MSVQLCPHCTYMNKTGSVPTGLKCTGGETRGFNNCFDEKACDRLDHMKDDDILRDIISSNCLGMNYTDRERKLIEKRLRGIIQRLEAM